MASFLSDAKARIQHNNKLSLAPKDIKNLADIISSEKNVLVTSSKLSVDYRKSAEALKEWGLNEGDDLADVLPKLSILLCHLADAQARFSDHDGTYRIHFKGIRMREESLAALKKGKETIQAKIVGLEKKIMKLSSENKDLPAFTNRLQESRSELISLESSVAIEEARLSDFKREAVREGLGLRLGAMLELAEKMTIVCEFGRMLTAQLPIERTAPGASRAPYSAASKTEAVVEEAQRSLTRVVFNPTPSAANSDSEASPDAPSPPLPPSDPGQPNAPSQIPYSFDSSKSLPAELPPLFFSSGATSDHQGQSHQSGGSPKNAYGTDAREARMSLNSHTSLPHVQRLSHAQQIEDPSHPAVTPQPLYKTNMAYPLPSLSQDASGPNSGLASSRNPADARFESRHRSSYSENAFYVLGPDGVPQSTGPSNPTEPAKSPPLYSPPFSSSPREGPKLPARNSELNYSNGPRNYPPSLTPANGTDGPISEPSRSEIDDTVIDDKPRNPLRYYDHPSPSPGVSGIPSSEGRTTNAGAFRRAVGNSAASPARSNARLPGPHQASIATDEAQTTGTTTSVHPLQINKRDTLGIAPK